MEKWFKDPQPPARHVSRLGGSRVLPALPPGSPDDRDLLPSHCSQGNGGSVWDLGERVGTLSEPEAADSTEGESTVCLFGYKNRNHLKPFGHFRHFSLFDLAEALLTSNQNTR